jgi:glycosyltransferase involved in cell wall biosynthesis
MAEAALQARQTQASKTRSTFKTPKFYIDIAPLQETEYTGIPQVVAKLCEEMIGDDKVDPRFFYNRYEIPRWFVEHLLKERNGSLIRWAAARYVFEPLVTRPEPDQAFWGLHTNMKFNRRQFPIEGQIVHDLTTLVTPEHHTADTNTYHQTKFYGDLMSNDVIFAVSQSTASDVIDFYPDTKATPLVVTHLGVDWSHIAPSTQALTPTVEPYIFVLGTLEPRKNVAVVLELLERDPSFAQRYRVVFGGRVGWGDAFERQLEKRGLTALAQSGRILQTGFVTETVKYRLLKHAAAVVYPSVYEGFGLPLAEAISLGVPAVTTASSSLPEVGREFAHYFDPLSADSFAAALEAAVKSGPTRVSRSGESLESWLSYFSWSRCYGQVRDAFFRLYSRGEIHA